MIEFVGWFQGRSDGGIWVYTPPKSVQVKFYGVKITSERLLNMSIKFYTSSKKIIPPKQISGYAPGWLVRWFIQFGISTVGLSYHVIKEQHVVDMYMSCKVDITIPVF